jgi:hypothetical protein
MTAEHDGHDEMENAVAAFVLDACDEDERETVRVHVEGCLHCRELARRLSRAAEAIPLVSRDVRPPARLRERILASAAVSPPGTQQEAPPAPAARMLPLPPPAKPARPPERWRLLLPAVAVLVAGLVALAAWNVRLNQPPSRYAMTGIGSMSGASGEVTDLGREGKAEVSLTSMPQPEAGHVYQLWLIDGSGHLAPARVFTPDSRGNADLVLDRSLHNVKQVVVTQEAGPAGAQAPTRKPELAGQVG